MILSTHTGGFGKPATLSVAKNFSKFQKHWHQADVGFENILVGYLGSETQVYEEINLLLAENASKLVVLDPAFADHGKLYSGMSRSVVDDYLLLCQHAQVLLPNLTEACFLIGQTVPITIDEQHLSIILEKLSQKTGVADVGITGVELNNQIGTAFLSDKSFTYVSSAKISGNFFGTGDLFSSLVFGFLLNGETFLMALKLANQWTSAAVTDTIKQSSRDSRMGIVIPSVLSKILTYKGS